MRYWPTSSINSLLKGLTGVITTRLVIIVSASILITAGLGYLKLYQVTEVNAEVRIDRAARAATSLLTEKLASEYTAIRDQSGKPMAVRLNSDSADMSLTFREEHDTLLKEIGLINQGAANLFRFNPETNAFDRFATTFRKPDGTMPPPMSISSGHPAYDDIFNNRPHMGEVPVMGRLRLAYLIPIQTMNGSIAGALAVDVGWVDDLISARDELRVQFGIVAVLILALATASGVRHMSVELRPLRELARFADDLAAEIPTAAVPYRNREDEIGALAQGLERVVTLQNKLAHLAYTDELTGLGNRSQYISDLRNTLRENQADKHTSALLHLDLDNFKQINDAYGQKSGDDLLKMVASKVSTAAGKTSKISRLASDQFTVLIKGKDSVSQIVDVAQEIHAIFANPFQLAEIEVHVTASLGVTVLENGPDAIDESHRNAGLALGRAKANGGGQLTFYSTDMNDEFQDQVRMDRMLKQAIRERQIELHFQPQIIPTRNGLTGVEALARWTHPEEGSIPPSKFIPVAEASGQIIDLGGLVLDLACEQAAKWNKENFDFKHISVNVSAIQLWQSNFIDVLQETLSRHGLAGQYICIEITESVFADHNQRRIVEVLSEIRALGVKLSLDDFGSGYSSLGYLNRLPFDQLKIDRSFVTNIDSDQRKQKTLRGILELARGLGFEIVVEGVETHAENSTIEGMGCYSSQGFFYAKPAPASHIPGMILEISQQKGCLEQLSA